MDSAVFSRNMLTLAGRDSDLAARLSAASSAEDVRFEASRSGPVVPVLLREGRPVALHSRFDPVVEGERLARAAPGGFVVAFGLGGGYHLQPLLTRRDITGLVIVESGAALVRRLLEVYDLSDLFLDSRVIFTVGPEPDELKNLLLERYLPVLYGDMVTWPLRTRVKADEKWFGKRADALRSIPDVLGRDYTVQARFGRRWFAHTLVNLARAAGDAPVLPPGRRMLITAAGPSLETQLPRIRDLQRDKAVLLATDTSLPTLAATGIEPDVVLSIDCQAVSYHHFLKGLPNRTVLVLDLASPPTLTRLSKRTLFFSSGHPFSLYLNRLYRPFPILDTSGGNVTHAALSLAHLAGAETVHIFGADYSYPLGRPYARGTYLYPFFQHRSERKSPSENAFWDFIARSRPRREEDARGWRLRTAAMDHYRESLENYARTLPIQVVGEPGDGVLLNGASGRREPRNAIRQLIAAGPARAGWREVLEGYRRRLRALPPLVGPPQDYLAALDTEERQTWATLLPGAAGFRKEANDGPSAVEASRLWTLHRLETFLHRNKGPGPPQAAGYTTAP